MKTLNLPTDVRKALQSIVALDDGAEEPAATSFPLAQAGDIARDVLEKHPEESDLVAMLVAALEAAQEELRLIRMKDNGTVYNPTLKFLISDAIYRAKALS